MRHQLRYHGVASRPAQGPNQYVNGSVLGNASSTWCFRTRLPGMLRRCRDTHERQSGEQMTEDRVPTDSRQQVATGGSSDAKIIDAQQHQQQHRSTATPSTATNPNTDNNQQSTPKLNEVSMYQRTATSTAFNTKKQHQQHQ